MSDFEWGGIARLGYIDVLVVRGTVSGKQFSLTIDDSPKTL